MPARLTQYRLCPRSRSIRLAMAELAHDFTLRDENPWEWRQGLLAMNPSGEMPVLETEDGVVVCGAYAISEYLGDTHTSTNQPGTADLGPAGRGRAATPSMTRGSPSRLFPGNHEDRAEVRRLADWFHGKFDREVTRELLYEKVYQRMRPQGGVPPNADILRVARSNLKYHLAYLSFLSDSRHWLAGDDLSFADFAAAAHISTADYLGEIHWDEVPSVKSWYQRIKSRPCFRALLSDKVPGTIPSSAYADLDF